MEEGKTEINLSYTHCCECWCCRCSAIWSMKAKKKKNDHNNTHTVRTMHERIKRISEFVDASVDLSLSSHAAGAYLNEFELAVRWMLSDFVRAILCSPREKCIRACATPGSARSVSTFSWFVLNFNSLFLACLFIITREEDAHRWEDGGKSSCSNRWQLRRARQIRIKWRGESAKPKVQNLIVLHYYITFDANAHVIRLNRQILCAFVSISNSAESRRLESRRNEVNQMSRLNALTRHWPAAKTQTNPCAKSPKNKTIKRQRTEQRRRQKWKKKQY